jgi:hypothetical protein
VRTQAASLEEASVAGQIFNIAPSLAIVPTLILTRPVLGVRFITPHTLFDGCGLAEAEETI